MANKIIVSEIQDSWETIIDKINNGMADYAVGQYKPLDLGCQGIVRMQIVAKGENASKLAESEGNATYDFVSMEVLRMRYQMNEWHFLKNPWERSSMRTYLNAMVFMIFPAYIAYDVKTVSKLTDGIYTTDRLWIPSYEEIFKGVYSDIYKNAQSRQKVFTGTSYASSWWLRSTFSGYSDVFRVVNMSGSADYDFANYSYGIALGFSL